MSHFTVLVFGDDVENLLAPYDENIEVEPYIYYTRAQAVAKSRKRVEDYKNEVYSKFIADPEAYIKEHNLSEEDGHLKYLRNEFPLKLTWTDEEHYQYMKEDFNDDMVDEEGNLYSTYNPKSKWDWYSVGGRWNGQIPLKSGGYANSALAYEIDWDKMSFTFAFRTPDGEWHERGEMGWWAIVSNEKEKNDWETEFKNVIDEFKDEDIYVTLVDCHI